MIVIAILLLYSEYSVEYQLVFLYNVYRLDGRCFFIFIAYTDASIQNKRSVLAFTVVFEDKSKISKRIIVNQTNSNIAEALAFKELVSFLDNYNFENGIVLFDSNCIKSHLKKTGYISKKTKEIIKRLNVRTQIIPRKHNIAHQVCSGNKPLESTPIYNINRHYYKEVKDFPDYFLQLSVLAEYRQIYNKHFATYHEAQMKLSKKIWLGDLVEDSNGIKIYAIHDKRIEVHEDAIVKISKVNYIHIGNHWRVIKKRKKLKKMLGEKVN